MFLCFQECSTVPYPIARCENFCFFVLYHTYHSTLRMVVTPPVTFNWPEKLANHGVRQLLPLAPPMGQRRPNQAYRPHPHIMG
jgi:hypothetical protein